MLPQCLPNSKVAVLSYGRLQGNGFFFLMLYKTLYSIYMFFQQATKLNMDFVSFVDMLKTFNMSLPPSNYIALCFIKQAIQYDISY